MPGKALVLLVDDDADFLDVTSRVLEAAGYRVERCAAPAAALERMESERPDIVLTDLMMDSLDAGFSLAKRLRELPGAAGVPVVVVTSASSAMGFDFRPRSGDDLAAMGADAFLEKPVPPRELLATVARLLADSGKGGAP